MVVWIAAASAAPNQISVAYTASYDIAALGDQVCPVTKLCDCTAQYTGVGLLVEQGENHVTFEGSWAVLTNSCGPTFTAWTPKDGKALHTIRHGGRMARSWAVHDDVAADGPVPVGQLGGGRLEMAVVDQRWPAKSLLIQNTETLKTPEGLEVKVIHDVAISFRK